MLLRGVNDSTEALLDLCFALLDDARIMPYYFYLCDMIPNAEHWRLSVREAQQLQHNIMGYLPGFATPRMLCDVPYVGKRWVHQVARYDTELGVSYWTKNYRTAVEQSDPQALEREYEYYDPIYTLPPAGQQWWRDRFGQSRPARSGRRCWPYAWPYRTDRVTGPNALPAALTGWLGTVLPGRRVTGARRLSGGFSNENLLISTETGGTGTGGRFVLRRYLRANRCAVEAALAARLAGIAPVPGVVAADPDGTAAGEPVLLSAFAAGVPLSEVLAGLPGPPGPGGR